MTELPHDPCLEARDLFRCASDYDPTTGLTPFQLHLQKCGYARPPQSARSAALRQPFDLRADWESQRP